MENYLPHQESYFPVGLFFLRLDFLHRQIRKLSDTVINCYKYNIFNKKQQTISHKTYNL